MRRIVNGILLLDKPAGITSNGALQCVKRLFQAKKAGHTGSLDPIATGMLPICFGEATKFSQFLLESDKTYEVVGTLGVRTTTGDTEGSVVETLPVTGVTVERVKEVMSRFVGEIDQIPPMFSAIKVQGQALYELARRGIEVERKARRIKIFSLTLNQLEPDSFRFHVHCSKGTYVRTLVEDIGRELGCGAHVKELRRQIVMPYDTIPMLSLSALEEIAKTSGVTELDALLLPVETSVNKFPAVQLSTSAAFYLRMGQAVRSTLPLDTAYVRLMSEDGRFLGMGEVLPDGRVKPNRLVSAQAA
jgi:tRNA pseudouridine55 synthase